jgi:hypothetical protein
MALRLGFESQMLNRLHSLYVIIIIKQRGSSNPLMPELNLSAQRCLTKFLLGILLLEPCI